MPPPAISTVMIRSRCRGVMTWRAEGGNCERPPAGWTVERRAANVPISREDRHVQALLRPRHLRARFAYHAGGGRRRLHRRAARLQEQPAEQRGISRDK